MKAQKVPFWIFKKVRGVSGKFLASADISHSTLRSGDLLEAFYNHFAPAGYKCPYGLAKVLRQFPSFRQWQRGTFDCEKWNDDVTDEFDEMLQVLENWAADYLLPFHYIGTTDGDGSAFGIWCDISNLENDLRYDDWEKVDDENHVQGNDRVSINERGNVAYYRNGKELFSYC